MQASRSEDSRWLKVLRGGGGCDLLRKGVRWGECETDGRVGGKRDGVSLGLRNGSQVETGYELKLAAMGVANCE
jgi:hypothetical protein